MLCQVWVGYTLTRHHFVTHTINIRFFYLINTHTRLLHESRIFYLWVPKPNFWVFFFFKCFKYLGILVKFLLLLSIMMEPKFEC